MSALQVASQTRCYSTRSDTEWGSNHNVPKVWQDLSPRSRFHRGCEVMKEVPANIRRMAHDREFRVTLRIGRSGLSDAMFDELDAQLRSRKVVKVKMNKGLTDERDERRQVFEEIAERTGAVLVDARGNVAIYWRN